MKIGEKIKKLRLKKGFTQENIHTQSTVAAIEKGNMIPSEPMLRKIAEELEISYDSLINGTDWKPTDKMKMASAYAIAPSEVKVTIDDNGGWHYEHPFYPIKDSDGGENKFSPITGEALIYECEDCKRPISKPEYKYCMGCGRNLVPVFHLVLEIDEIMSLPFMNDHKATQECLHQLITFSEYCVELKYRVKNLKTMLEVVTIDKKTEADIRKTVGKDYNETKFKNQGVQILNEIGRMGINVGDYRTNEDSEINYKGIHDNLDFNLKIVDGLKNIMQQFLQKNTEPRSIETMKQELFGRLANTIDEVALFLAAELTETPAMDKLTGSNEESRSNRVKQKVEALNQLKEMLQTLEDVKDESYKDIDNLINKASALSDEKISNDLEEEKSESTENNDSSSIKDEKSKDNKKKGA